jgi:hypothetical protein
MKLRIVLGLALLLALHAGLHTATPVQASTSSFSCDPAVAAALDKVIAGQKCIPCSPNKPCTNPLTVCSYVSPTHGCCLGYAP